MNESSVNLAATQPAERQPWNHAFLALLHEEHRKDPGSRYCTGTHYGALHAEVWPCRDIRFLATIEAAERERDAAVSALTRVRELHKRSGEPSSMVQTCRHCGYAWPCPTVAALPPVDSPEEPHREVKLARDRAVCAADGLPWPCKGAERG